MTYDDEHGIWYPSDILPNCPQCKNGKLWLTERFGTLYLCINCAYTFTIIPRERNTNFASTINGIKQKLGIYK